MENECDFRSLKIKNKRKKIECNFYLFWFYSERHWVFQYQSNMLVILFKHCFFE